jgi:hypothetical protein
LIYFLVSAVADVCLIILLIAHSLKYNFKNSLYLFRILDSHSGDTSLDLELFAFLGEADLLVPCPGARFYRAATPSATVSGMGTAWTLPSVSR